MTIFNAPTIFPIAPEGAAAIVRTRAWSTEIQPTPSGKETRLANRSDAVTRIEFTITNAVARDLWEYLALWYNATERLRFLVPLWGEDTIAEAFPSTTRIDADTTDREFRAGGKALLWVDRTRWEIVDLDTIASDHVTLATPMTTTAFWTAFLAPGIGAVSLVPLSTAWLIPPTRNQINPEAEQVALRFDEELGGIAGIDDGVGEAVVPAGVDLVLDFNDATIETAGWRYYTITARVIHASGLEVPNPPVAWDVVANGTLPVTDPSVRHSVVSNGKQFHMEFPADADGTFLVTATYGAVSRTVELGG